MGQLYLGVERALAAYHTIYLNSLELPELNPLGTPRSLHVHQTLLIHTCRVGLILYVSCFLLPYVAYCPVPLDFALVVCPEATAGNCGGSRE